MSEQFPKDFEQQILTEQQKRELIKKWNSHVEEFNRDIEKENEIDFSELTTAKDVAKPWHDNPHLFHIDGYERIIAQALINQWGDSAKIEFDRENSIIKCIHESGLSILI